MERLTLKDKLDIVKRVVKPNILPKTQGELDIFIDMLKRTSSRQYYEVMKRLDVVDTTTRALNSACEKFWSTIEEHFPDAALDAALHPQVQMQFNTITKMAVLNWVSRNLTKKN